MPNVFCERKSCFVVGDVMGGLMIACCHSVQVYMHAKSLQSCLTLCNPMDYIAHQEILSMGFSR